MPTAGTDARRRARALRLAGLYAITPDLVDTARLIARVVAAIDGGARAIQYRNKSADAALRRAQTAALAQVHAARGALYIVNDDAALAAAVDADGVHLGEDDGGIEAARELVGPERIIGVSCYNRFARWRKAGVWDRLLGAVSEAYDGDIVMIDELVALAKDDREIYAVLAHELGHLEKRHSLRQLLQGTIVGLVISWYLGDISSILASAPAAILQARYSRDFEREADAFGASMLMHNNISPGYLANMLERLEKAHGRERDKESYDYFSTHPGADERVRELREL